MRVGGLSQPGLVPAPRRKRLWAEGWGYGGVPNPDLRSARVRSRAEDRALGALCREPGLAQASSEGVALLAASSGCGSASCTRRAAPQPLGGLLLGVVPSARLDLVQILLKCC